MTGVQTCALPIYAQARRFRVGGDRRQRHLRVEPDIVERHLQPNGLPDALGQLSVGVGVIVFVGERHRRYIAVQSWETILALVGVLSAVVGLGRYMLAIHERMVSQQVDAMREVFEQLENRLVRLETKFEQVLDRLSEVLERVAGKQTKHTRNQ